MRVLLVAAAAILASCSGGAADYEHAARIDPEEARAQAGIDAAANSAGIHAVQRAGLPVTGHAATAAGARALPIAFQGFWGVTPDDCELANVEAQGRIRVDADQIRFHESRARVEAATRRSPTIVDTELRFSGEGQSWERDTRFVLEAGGTRLDRIERAPDGRPRHTHYQRC